MSATDQLAVCDRNIAGCKAYAGPDDMGALLGWADWEAERLEPQRRYEEADFRARYDAFLKGKAAMAQSIGFEVDAPLTRGLKPHQEVMVRWACRGGRRAIFARFGLGKTIVQLEIMRLILERFGGRALIVCPLGVRQEFMRDARKFGVPVPVFVRSLAECGDTGLYITNYETVRDGKIDPAAFVATTLDEAAILRGFGGTKTFREFMRLFEAVRFRFVATATPDPNEYIELLAYSAYLGIMDVGEAKTRFFKRDATKADVLTLHSHTEEDFWLWVGTWALFLDKPSDLGFSDEGYDLPQMIIHYHEVKIERERATVADRDGQMQMFRNSSLGVVDASREKRDSVAERVSQAVRIMKESPEDHFLLWHDLEAERHAIKRAWPEAVSVYGDQDLEDRERSIAQFSDGEIQYLSTKPVLAGSGCNFQRHCRKAIFVGIGFKFAEFFQAIHRIHRFLQSGTVEIHLVYCETEREILKILLEKWKRHTEKCEKMSQIIREHGLNEIALAQALSKSMGVERVAVWGPGPDKRSATYRLVNNDAILEARRIKSDSVGLVLTSIPFSTQYEYTPSMNDFGHNEDNEAFFDQMDFLTPELYRSLMPGRVAMIHVKDRTVPGGISGFGFQECYPFHCDVIAHFRKHGFRYLGMKTITTDVVRENNQTYRLGWTEQCKDSTKMGYGMPEYLLMFRKPQSDLTRGYADVPVVKDKKRYSKARWQVDAHAYTRSNGDRPLMGEEIKNLSHQKLFGMFHDYYRDHVYNFEHHVELGEAIGSVGRLPVTFMLLQPPSPHSDVWTDITRMLTINALQAHKGRQKHICPMQFDIADRVITQHSNSGDLVLDPFGGLMTVPMRAIALGRKALSFELNHGYFLDGAAYCKAAAEKVHAPTLFDLIAAEDALSGEMP